MEVNFRPQPRLLGEQVKFALRVGYFLLRCALLFEPQNVGFALLLADVYLLFPKVLFAFERCCGPVVIAFCQGFLLFFQFFLDLDVFFRILRYHVNQCRQSALFELYGEGGKFFALCLFFRR